MKNSTKVRLHLSKKLFESLTREIIKEAKANDGYTVAVKQPKAPKQVKEVNAVADTDKMKKMEEKMSSKEKMAKGLYNEVDAEMDTDKMKKMKEATDFSDTHNHTYRLVDGNCIRINPETQERAKVHHTYCNDLKKEMQTNVAEENPMKEFTGTETESSGAIAMIATALGLGIPLATALIKDLMRAKSPEEKKQLIQKKLADKSAGMDKGTDALKEYENDDYRVVNGQCRRYNDEHEYTVVSMSYCR